MASHASADDMDPFAQGSGTRPPSYHEDQDTTTTTTNEATPSARAASSSSSPSAPHAQQQQQQQQHAPLPPPEIDMSTLSIIDAQKTTDHVGASSFIVYVIRTGTTEAKRRYSEFEALRSALVSLHPTLIIPPIPDKHTLSDYAVRQSKAKEDATIIARRKRMLQSFLRRCASHPTLQSDAVLRKFLDGRFPWHEILTTPPLSHLPKSNLRAPPQNPADPQASPAYASLPLPPSSTGAQQPLRNPSQRFLDSEAFTNRFAAHMSQSLEKANRRVARRWSDSSGDFAELGAVLNGFSLSESGALALAIERTGQAADSTFMSIGGLLGDWEQSFTEPLHEYVQFASVLQKLLKWRQAKHVQFEMAQDALEAKRLKLGELERIEAEARRLDRALETGGRSLGLGTAGAMHGGGAAGRRGKSSIYGSAVEGEDEEGASAERGRSPGLGDEAGWSDGIGSPSAGAAAAAAPSNDENAAAGNHGANASRDPAALRHRPSHSSSSSGAGGGGGLLSSLTSTFSSFLDVDPESTRRREISRLREEILLLDEGLKLTAADLKWATGAIQTDLDRFQRGKVRDFKGMMLAVARMHREFCRVNLQNWQEAKDSIDAIEGRVQPASSAEQWPTGRMPESSLTRHEERNNSNSSSAGASSGGGAGGGAGKTKRKGAAMGETESVW